MGSKGSSMDFSWTWKEKRKKASEEVKRERGNSVAVGGNLVDTSLVGCLGDVPFDTGCKGEDWDVIDVFRRMNTAGKRAKMVARSDT